MSFTARLVAFRKKHHIAMNVVFFTLGFLFDLTMVEHIDSRPMLIQQGAYIVLLIVLIGVDHRLDVRGSEPAGVWGNILGLREWLLHFLLGTMLNASLILYFKSAASLAGGEIVFVAAVVILLVLNELRGFARSGRWFGSCSCPS